MYSLMTYLIFKYYNWRTSSVIKINVFDFYSYDTTKTMTNIVFEYRRINFHRRFFALYYGKLVVFFLCTSSYIKWSPYQLNVN